MSNQQHPIAPPPELVQQWAYHCKEPETVEQFWQRFATQAAQWGADQELEACCELLDELPYDGPMLHDARRPKPPTLKEQALLILHDLPNMDCAHYNIILRALEALPND